MSEMVITAAHVLAAVFASFRLTELFLMDRITGPIRKRYPHYLWTCPRCLSVWTGAAVTLIFYVFPWLNWPLAFSYFYLVEIDWRAIRRMPKLRRA